MLTYQNDNNDRNHPNDISYYLAAILTVVFVVSGAMFAIFVLSCLRAWVIATLWDWYLVPSFHLPSIGLPTAFGVSLLVGYLLRIEKQDDKKWKEKLAEGLLMPFIVIFIGWIGTLFM